MANIKNDVASYKGYQAQLIVDIEDNIIYGRVLGLERDQISFHAESVAEAKAEFESTINEYLKECAADGVEAETPKRLATVV